MGTTPITADFLEDKIDAMKTQKQELLMTIKQIEGGIDAYQYLLEQLPVKQ